MTIADGYIIEADDVNTAFNSAITFLQSDETNKTANIVVFSVPDLVDVISSTVETKRSYSFISPDDFIILNWACQVIDGTGSVCSSALSCESNQLLNGTFTYSETPSTNDHAMSRLFTASGQPLQIFAKGAKYKITVSTASATAVRFKNQFVLQAYKRRLN